MVGKVRFLLPHEAEVQRTDQAQRRGEFVRQYAAPYGEEGQYASKPFVLRDDGGLTFNRYHVGRAWPAAHRPVRHGTSIFLNFATSCHIHQAGLWGFDKEGYEIAKQISSGLWVRCEDVIVGIKPGFVSADLVDDEVDISIRPESCPDHDNGEIYIHFKRRVMCSKTASDFSCALFESVCDNPIPIALGGDSLPIVFYGCGFRLT